MDYLDHVICHRRLERAEHRTHVIEVLQPSTYVTELCKLPGLCSVSCCFVPSFVRIAAPLKNNLKKDQFKHYDFLTAEKLRALHQLLKNWSPHHHLRYRIPKKKVHARYRYL